MREKRFFITCIALFILIFSSSSSSAATLEVVFKDTLWGGAIGSVVGLAVWALEDEDGSKAGKMVVRGAALGILSGMIYGFYDANQLGYVQATPTSQGLVHYNASQDHIEITPAYLLPQLKRLPGELSFQSTVFSSTF